jgi:hypothetical protein
MMLGMRTTVTLDEDVQRLLATSDAIEDQELLRKS